MPIHTTQRLDELPLDRRAAGEARGESISAVYERREVDPTAPHFKRRHGSLRNASTQPNLLGATSASAKGHIHVDHDFTTATGTDWSIFGTLDIPTSSDVTAASYFKVLSFGSVRLYLKKIYDGDHKIRFIVLDSSATLLAQTSEYDLDTSDGNAFHFFLCRDTSTSDTLRLNAWYVDQTATPGADTTAAYSFTAEASLDFFGEAQAGYTVAFDECVLNNVMVYDNDDFAVVDYDSTASDTTPDTTGLLWHDVFSNGGDILSFRPTGGSDILSYLVPTQPQTFGADPQTILFGGNGTAEIPFYLDFDEYFWTTTNASARLNWCFQLKLTLPNILSTCTVFELQDLIRLDIVEGAGRTEIFQANFNDSGTIVTSAVTLTAGTSYDVFVARDDSLCYIKVDSAEVSGAESNPIIYDYDKTIGFIVGDRVDFENSSPFTGEIERFALHNNETRAFQSREDAVFYFTVDSIQGDEFLDRGNRALNGYLGARSDTQPPFYKQGGFPGGTYVAAAGGYLISNSRPDIGYDGQLSKPLLKDAVVQRRGERSFLTSNGVSYLVDDRTKTFRPLGIPRPGTKVACTPQGIGPIDGFVRYAYRYVTTDGTVGPVFELDPCDATGGVNVLLGADNFGTPEDPAFGLSFGDCPKDKEVASDEVGSFIAVDKSNDGTNTQLLHTEKKDGLTLEAAIRLPKISAGVDESVISQGAYAPFGPETWLALNQPKEFEWIGKQNHECTFQFSFRFCSGSSSQTLFCIGSQAQRYETGWLSDNTHWNLHSLVVSIQPPANVSNNYCLMITRSDPKGNKHRDDDLHHWDIDVDLVDDNDYTIFVKRTGSEWGNSTGADLSVMLYNHTTDDWTNFPDFDTTVERYVGNYFGNIYAAAGGRQIMWGACRKQGNNTSGKTRVRSVAGGAVTFDMLPAFYNGTTGSTSDGSRMYHGRMWKKAHNFALLANKALLRYGARTGPLNDQLEVDVAFCPDSSTDVLDGGWDAPNELLVQFYAPAEIQARTVLTDAVDTTVVLAYGFDNTITPGTPDTHAIDSTDKVPLWCVYSTRDQGSLIFGAGRFPAISIAEKKWYDGSGVRTFDEFADTIDLTQWTWITLAFEQHLRHDGSGLLDVFLTELFIDGNTGDWGVFFNGDTSSAGPGGKKQNTASGAGQYTLFTVGGVPGIDNAFEIEIAEVRLWEGYIYVNSLGEGSGTEEFGPYLSTRIPPNKWDALWHYLRFVPLDVNDMDSQATMDTKGTYVVEAGLPNAGLGQATSDAVSIYQTAEVKENEDTGSGGSSYFIPFPTPPLSSIRGIQLFRTQVVPVEKKYPNGEHNPNAQTDGFKACRAAPLYYLSEIPDGTSFYFDSATDALLGAELNLTEGLIPGNPGGVFEWDNHLAIWVTDIPRIHFAASPDSWESFPSDMVLDLPLREYGTIEAATELASRDARQSRVLVLGKSWGLFLDGSPTNPRVNTLGGGVGAASSRCLVVEKGIAYAYNGTLWAITGDGAVEDIGLPVIDLLPPPDSARLSVSSSLGSLYVINEDTGVTLRWHFARREWFVEDRNALSTTDISGVDNWVHLTGWPSKGDTTVYADDVETDTPTSLAVLGINNDDDYFSVADVTGFSVGQRVTLAADEDPRIRQTVTISRFQGTRIYTTEDLDLPATSTNNPSGDTVTLNYTAYAGVGYWGTMLDTGQFRNTGVLHHVDMGVTDGDRWYAMSAGADFAGDPTDRSSFDSAESNPTRIIYSGVGTSARWGLTERQRIQRLLVWSYEPEAVGLSEFELAQTPNE